MATGTGTATIDFGAFPGSNEASIAVTGQGSILATSKAEPVKTTGVSKATQSKRQAAQDAKIAEQVEKAEHDLAVLTQGLKDVQAAQRFTQALLLQARTLPEPEFDFMAVAQEYRARMRREDD